MYSVVKHSNTRKDGFCSSIPNIKLAPSVSPPFTWALDVRQQNLQGKVFFSRVFSGVPWRRWKKTRDKMETVQMLPVTKRASKAKERSLIQNSTSIQLQRPEPQNRQMQSLEKRTLCKHIQQDWSSVKSTKHMGPGAEHPRPQITQGMVGYSKRVGFYYKLKVHYNFPLHKNMCWF